MVATMAVRTVVPSKRLLKHKSHVLSGWGFCS